MPRENVIQKDKELKVINGWTLEQFDHNLIDDAVKYINSKIAENVFKTAIDIGKYILKNIYNDDDDIEIASSRNPNKPQSYKALCEHEDLDIDPATLGLMVNIVAQERFFLKNQIDTGKLNYTHGRELVKFHNNDLQLELAIRCINDALSTRDLPKIVTQKRLELKKDKTLSSPARIVNQYISQIDGILKKVEFPEFDLNRFNGEFIRDKTRTFKESRTIENED